MATVGYSTSAASTPADTPENSVPTSLEKAMLDELVHLRRKLAMYVDNHVEPDDPTKDDFIRNAPR